MLLALMGLGCTGMLDGIVPPGGDASPVATLPAPPQGVGTLLRQTEREHPDRTTETVQYTLAEGVQVSSVLDRYEAEMRDRGLTPVRKGLKVSAETDLGMVTAQVVRDGDVRVLTLVSVQRDPASLPQ